MLRRTALLLTAVLVVAMTAAGSALAQDDEAPLELTLESNLAGAGFGERVIVSGTDWPANSIVQVQLCGNLALNGSADCDQVTSVQAGVNTTGAFAAVVLVGNPPVPCPCVFLATSTSTSAEATLPFEVRGAAVSPDDPSAIALPERRLAVTEARIDGSGPWTALFGARPNRTLVLTVLNNGAVAVDNPAVELALGKGADPTGFVTPPELGRLEPGDSVTVQVDLDLPVFAIGTYAVEGSIPGFDPPVRFRAESSHVPWLLLLIPLLILIQLSLVAIRNRVRDRIHEPELPALPPAEVAVPAGAVAVSGATAAPASVIDLRDEQPAEPEAEWEPTPGTSVFGDEAEPVEAEEVEEVEAEEAEAEEAEAEEAEAEPVVAGADMAEEEAPEEVEAEEEPDELETIIGEELAAVFDDAFRRHDDSISDSDFRDLIVGLSATAAGRVAERTDLSAEERNALDMEIADEVLSAFGFEKNSTA